MKFCEAGCGTEVRFVLMSEDPKVWSLPMTAVSKKVTRPRVKGFEYPDIVITERFTPHLCPQMEQMREDRRLRDQQNHAISVDRVRQTAAAWKEALKVSCPKCPSVRGKRCLNLTKAKQGIEQHTSWPHAERLPEGWLEEQI